MDGRGAGTVRGSRTTGAGGAARAPCVMSGPEAEGGAWTARVAGGREGGAGGGIGGGTCTTMVAASLAAVAFLFFASSAYVRFCWRTNSAI